MKLKYLKNNFINNYPLKEIQFSDLYQKNYNVDKIKIPKKVQEKPVIISIDKILLDGYKRYFLIKKNKKKEGIPVIIYPCKLSNKEKKKFFQFRENILKENLPFYQKVKFFILLYPEVFYAKNFSPNKKLIEIYKNIQKKVLLSYRQQQRIKSIYKRSLLRAINKKQKYIKNKDIIKIIEEENEKRRIHYQNQKKIPEIQ